jgi:hypothetical protein
MREVGDPYDLFLILGSYTVTITFFLLGGICTDGGWQIREWCFIGLAFLLDIVASAVATVGCLLWDWRRCLRYDQEHSQRNVFHGGMSVSGVPGNVSAL